MKSILASRTSRKWSHRKIRWKCGKKIPEGLFCNATFWIESELPSNPSYNCGEETDEVTVEYLDCLCETNWGSISGSGNEEPIEAAYLALCRSTENPPDSCSDAISPFNDADPLANLGFIREKMQRPLLL